MKFIIRQRKRTVVCLFILIAHSILHFWRLFASPTLFLLEPPVRFPPVRENVSPPLLVLLLRILVNILH